MPNNYCVYPVICLIHLHVIYANIFCLLLQHTYLYKQDNRPLNSIHILYNLAASEKLMAEIGSERVLISKTVTWIKAALLNENKSG